MWGCVGFENKTDQPSSVLLVCPPLGVLQFHVYFAKRHSSPLPQPVRWIVENSLLLSLFYR